MHALMTRVLEQRQLNAAGQLFTTSDYDVITDLHTAFCRIKEIFNAPHYVDRRVDQSIVEIVIARITTAIREIGCIETYSAELVDILDSCLNHPMTVVDSEGECIDSPHCKIASDLLSSLFLHYGKRSVMTLTLPVAMKAVGSSNQELVRNTTSYISLAAIHNGKALAQYSVQIISHIINGNYSLLRVLPQIYQDNREPFHAHISQLLAVLEARDVDCSEKLSLLQLASMMANSKPDLLIPYLSQFDKYLLSPSTCTAVLNIYMSLVSQGRAHCLAPFLSILKKASQRPAFSSNQATISKIIGNIGRVSLPLASEAIDELVRSTELADAQLLSSILIEIEGVGEAWPSSLRSHIEALRLVARSSNTRVVDRIIALAGDSSAQLINGDVTVISIQNGEKNSCDSLLSKEYTGDNGDVNIISSGARTMFPVCDSPADSCALELDRNTHHLAMQYQNRSSGSLPRHYSRSRASVAHSLQGQRTTSENVTISGSRDLSLSSVAPSVAGSLWAPHDYVTRPPPVYNPPKTQTLPAGFAPNTQIQIGKDGRVRPCVGSRRPAQWPIGSYETTFPAHSGPITTTKMNPLCEEDERQWASSVDRSDVVLQFVEHRKNKIRRFISEVTARFPIPMQCTVEGSKNSKHRMIVHFSCQARSMYCVFSNEYLFAFKTKFPSAWLHLMFLQMQSSSIESSGEVISQSAQPFLTLAHCWQCLPPAITRNKEFVTLVTSAFPTTKEQYKMLKELEEASFFDCFSLDGPLNRWTCFSCTHPDKVRSFVEDGSTQKVLEGQLKEKKGRWWFLRRWQTKYFTLSSAALTYSTQHMNSESNALLPAIDLKSIRSVRSLSRGRKSRKSLRKAFEIFTSDNSSVVLKATDEKKAEEWLQCLQIAVAHAKREGN